MIHTWKEYILIQKAKNLLKKNYSEYGFTSPAPKLYPFQWNWDSGFIAYGYSFYNQQKAMTEMRTLFKGQWGNGMLPHMIFHENHPEYFPNHDFWDSSTNPTAPKIPTSGITQPPIHAIVVWQIYNELSKKDNKKARKFLEEMYPKLFKLHKYLLTERDPENSGLVTIYHPWESGLDNSPRWDLALERIEVPKGMKYKRWDTQVVESDERPTKKEYDRYLFLVEELKKHNYDDKKIYKDYPFKIKDVVISSILYKANIYLKKIGQVIGEDTKQIDKWLDYFRKGLYEDSFNKEDGFFYDIDLVSGEQIKNKTVAILSPIITGILDAHHIRQLIYDLDGIGFCGGTSCVEHAFPSTGEKEKEFDHERYWRGPLWINMNWFFFKAFVDQGMSIEAEVLRECVLGMIKRHGFCEYYSPLNHKGFGAKNFSWTAALTIALVKE